MVALAYFSAACGNLTESALDEIWRDAAVKNKRKDITGILLYKSTTFLQVLEGPEAAVEELYAKLKLDSRHSNLMQLYNISISDRQYPDWSMAFSNLESLDESGPGSGFRNLLFSSATAPAVRDHLHRMLAFFVNEFVNS